MIYVKMQKGRPVEFAETLTPEQQQDCSWQERWNWKDFETVTTIATYLTAMTGDIYLPVDRTESTSPRYDVMKAPKVGDQVSYGFNGDYYPDGEIVKITKTYQITTSSGNTYRRRKHNAGWLKSGGTWGLVQGHIDEQNPHF